MARWTRTPTPDPFGKQQPDNWTVRLNGEPVGYVRRAWQGKWQWGTILPRDFGQIDTLEEGLEMVRTITTQSLDRLR